MKELHVLMSNLTKYLKKLIIEKTRRSGYEMEGLSSLEALVFIIDPSMQWPEIARTQVFKGPSWS